MVGLEAKFSNANDKTAFWKLLINHQQTIRVIPDGRYQDVNKVFPETKKKDYFEAGYLEEIDKFDNTFFRLSPQEAKLMDPKQRLFLETAYKAMEDAGCTGERIRSSKTGVFVGVDHSGDSKYSYMSAIKEPDFLATVGNSASVLASRIAYIMDLKGPSMVLTLPVHQV
ncbi:putative hybrid nonribosomal peptide synthetase/polyketide synthase [Streptococcus macacae NCTC 11558]|uniref:Beta-ketoacyl synthase, N-terminal domain protein n=1 Tax=Streptococcus macacae NCTC 11558 TaxID=764298 RepID=G5JW27_9STRE|nr:beta-ketoacyl synthase N-terminal-like domain-containing protein [Streptococcus macacae]EHJ52099.1 beta-ketoacyl synthase, N-terminal domain protein [Streptococcus macacae NCTC 11558]SUN79361.1 putative hybrid nonribosomal peptide synthetase/polyketide synthase [Streptococcus macacae NCTC 11558]